MENSADKVIGIHQPNYIPWLGYFYKIAKVDVFVFLDDAQFSNKGTQNYHYIKTPSGSFRLKIPVKQSLGNKINEVITKDNLGWKKKHLKTLEMNYKKALHFEEVYQDFSAILNIDYPNIAIQNQEIISFITKKLGIKTILAEASHFNFKSTREEKILDLCNALQATVYYSGTGAKAYQKEEHFTANGVRLKYSDFQPIQYPQLWNNEFIPNVSILDYLMNCGYNWLNGIEKYNTSFK